MIIKVKVVTNSKQEKVEKLQKNEYKVWVTVPAKENKANKAVVKIMSNVLDVRKSSIHIVSGLKNKVKLLEV